MRRVGFIGLAVFAIWPFATAYPAATLYVDLNSTNPTSPFATWETAATNIQAAVNVAVDGDTVLVTNGVYPPGEGVAYGGQTNSILMTNGLLLSSVNGAASTIIDGGSVMRCVVISHANAKLDGFTVVNGSTPFQAAGVLIVSGKVDHCVIVSNNTYSKYGVGGGAFVVSGGRLVNSTVAWNLVTNQANDSAEGGGVYLRGGVVSNCSIVFNMAGEFGGGISASDSPATTSLVDGCYIVGNRVLATYSAQNGGGGVYCLGATITGCTISSNLSAGSGGGILLDHTSTVVNCVVERNQAKDGGGLCGGFAGGMATISNTLINANEAVRNGGGATMVGVGPSPTELSLTSCNISSNSAGRYGGLGWAYSVRSCSISANTATDFVGGAGADYFVNCIISNNTAGNHGGGASIGYSMSNCVVIGNVAGGVGGGLWLGPDDNCVNTLIVGNTSAVGGGVWGDFSTLLKNCTISGNHSATGGGVHGVSGTQVRNSIIYGNTALDGSNIVAALTNISYSCVAPLVSGAGNADLDPSFAAANAGNYRLGLGSACIDSGDAGGAPTADLDGVPRPLDGDNNGVTNYDMGAYEFGHPLVDSDGDDMNDSDEIGAGTSPLDSASVFAIKNSASDAAGWVVTWSSVTNKLYDLYHSTNLLQGFVRIATNVPATAPQNVFTDLTAAADANYYQVRVGR